MNKTNSLGFCFLQIANPKQNVDEGMFTDNTHQRLSVAANAGIILTQPGLYAMNQWCGCGKRD